MNKEIYIKELNSDITNLTTKIYLEFPELYLNIDETPLDLSDYKNEIALLYKYLETLKTLHKSFKDQHQIGGL